MQNKTDDKRRPYAFPLRKSDLNGSDSPPSGEKRQLLLHRNLYLNLLNNYTILFPHCQAFPLYFFWKIGSIINVGVGKKEKCHPTFFFLQKKRA